MGWLTRTRALRFVYTPSTRSSGTTVMRGKQLADLVAASGLRHSTITFEPIDLRVRNSDLFLTKGAARTTSPDQVERLRRRGNRVFLDPVDEGIDEETVRAADGLAAASFSAYYDWSSRWPTTKVVRVDHHVDPRLRKILQARTDLSAARKLSSIRYFGERENALMTPQIAEEVDFVQVDTHRQDDTWMSSVVGTDLHYAIRRARALDVHKPFLKGFTAAAAGANILVSRDEAEAHYWLPRNYPYWVGEGAAEEAILSALEYARDTFNGPVWRDAYQVMREVSEQTRNEVIVREFIELVA